MTVLISGQERTRSVGTKLTTTNATAVYTCTGIAGAKGVSLSLCNVDGSASVDATVEWHDASAATQYKLFSTGSVPNDTRTLFDLGGLWLDEDDEIRVTAGAANDLEAVATVIETLGGR